MSFQKSAADGDIIGALQLALVYGSLWAIGSSWSTAIRGVVLFILPDDSRDVVFGELISASITTVLGVTVSVAVARNWGRCCKPWCGAKKTEDAPPEVTRPQTLPSRRV